MEGLGLRVAPGLILLIVSLVPNPVLDSELGLDIIIGADPIGIIEPTPYVEVVRSRMDEDVEDTEVAMEVRVRGAGRDRWAPTFIMDDTDALDPSHRQINRGSEMSI